jgi:hypothetical protein
MHGRQPPWTRPPSTPTPFALSSPSSPSRRRCSPGQRSSTHQRALLPFVDEIASLPSGQTAPPPPSRASCCWHPDPCRHCCPSSNPRCRTAPCPRPSTPTPPSPGEQRSLAGMTPWPASAQGGCVAGVLSPSVGLLLTDGVLLRTPPPLPPLLSPRRAHGGPSSSWPSTQCRWLVTLCSLPVAVVCPRLRRLAAPSSPSRLSRRRRRRRTPARSDADPCLAGPAVSPSPSSPPSLVPSLPRPSRLDPSSLWPD